MCHASLRGSKRTRRRDPSKLSIFFCHFYSHIIRHPLLHHLPLRDRCTRAKPSQLPDGKVPQQVPMSVEGYNAGSGDKDGLSKTKKDGDEGSSVTQLIQDGSTKERVGQGGLRTLAPLAALAVPLAQTHTHTTLFTLLCLNSRARRLFPTSSA